MLLAIAQKIHAKNPFKRLCARFLQLEENEALIMASFPESNLCELPVGFALFIRGAVRFLCVSTSV